ncbi:Aminodeoxychorismate synthase component 1 [Frondihabitans sp. 762G35]|uniref:anthranilate synthase component I family protein n=1 Tax=Frondihabitans sp. 762G35 TaxID=1446794 RepID=UPI000D21CAD1|nr:anthranilate synthase component I family protein [Frondihabitans sp. 762G35]ARC57120.1 Aminodeoxychorismate synthase component 1 [Frondihabitans sp. 762G35]
MREPATRILLDGWREPERVVLALGATGDVVWFDAGVEADGAGATPREGHPGRSLVGWGSERLTASVRDARGIAPALDRLRRETTEASGVQEPLGWWGVLGYGAAAELLQPGDGAWADALGDPRHPDLAFLRVDRALVFDHDRGTVEAVTSGTQEAWLDVVREYWTRDPVTAAEPSPLPPPRREATWADGDGAYLALVDRCREAIRAGEASVFCLTTSVSVGPVAETDLEVYRRLRRSSPAPRASFVRIGRVSLLGASPETFLTVDGDGIVTSAPIKGTRPRGADPASDERLREGLRTSEKERAENLMIVDLMRNDLSRISVAGSVGVSELFAVRGYEHVHQLVSTVTSRLRPGASGVDAVVATFPPGSMTGAPKHRAVRLLSDWEAGARGLYSGAVGRLGFDGTVDLAVVIRSIVLDAETRRATVGVGGGITSASVPADELAEVRTKARALLAVLGVGDPGSSSPSPGSR